MKYYWDKERKTWVEKRPIFAGKSSNVMEDIKEFKSPIDGAMISSRSSLKEHEKRHEVRQVGNDWSGSQDYCPKPDWFDHKSEWS